MKKLIIIIALLTAGLSFATAQEYDTTDILWQKYIWPNACGGGKFSSDGKIIYAFFGEYCGSLSNKIIKLSVETGDLLANILDSIVVLETILRLKYQPLVIIL